MSTPDPLEPYPSQADPYPPGRPLASPLAYLHGGPVGFGEAIKQAFRNGFVYRGRASRSAYWWFVLFQVIAILVLELLIIIPAALKSGPVTVLFIVVFGAAVIYVALVALALTVRRLHDIDRTGWWVLIGLVPCGSIVLLVFSLLEGTPGPNRYQP